MDRKPQIHATLPDHVREEVERRSKAVGLSRAEYLTDIARWWYGEGAPAVSKDEARLMAQKSHHSSAQRAS